MIPINFIKTNDKANTIFGWAWDDHITALDGNDTIYTGNGNDTVIAGAGNDYVANDRGDDVFHGNTGNDTISFRYLDTTLAGQQPYNESTGVVFDLALSTKQFNLIFGLDEYHGFENAVGGGLNDILYGNNGGNRIEAGGGDDKVFGRDGRDKLEGSLGADTINGGQGADILGGYFADDQGTDYDRDVFIYKKASDSGATAATRDTVYGAFGGTSSSDIIDLQLIDANPFKDGNQSFVFVGNTAFKQWQVGEVRVKPAGDGVWSVMIDLDKDSDAEMVIRVHDYKAPVEADFIL